MNILDIIKVIVFGIVEGITEWLPISSTGHIILLEKFMQPDVSEAFWKMFRVVVQLGAIMAVVVIYWKNIFPWTFRKNQKPEVHKDILNLWLKILVACIPAAIVGVFFDDFFEALFYNEVSVSIALITFGIAFLIIETWNKGKEPKINSTAEITYKTALIIGAFQLIAAIFPGTSRSGATIVGALLLGVSRVAAAEFTFYLAIPVMFGASLLKLAKFFLGSGALSFPEITVLIVGMITAYVVSFFVIKMLLNYIKKHNFKVFGWYRIGLGALVLLAFVLMVLL